MRTTIVILSLLMPFTVNAAGVFQQAGGQWLQSHRPPIIQENPDTAIEGDELAGEPVNEDDQRELPNEDLAAPDDALTE